MHTQLVTEGKTLTPLSITRDIVAEYPLTHGQQALWFLNKLTPESVAYNIAQLVRVRSPLVEDKARLALSRLAERHPVLRTTFAEVDGKPVQRVHRRLNPELEFVDAANWDDAQIRKQLEEATFRPFNLETGPLLRITVLRRADDDYLLHMVIHHIIADMWSLALILNDLPALYGEVLTGEPSGLKPPRRTYEEHVYAEAEMLAGPKGEALWAFWSKQLAGDRAVLELPTDRPRPPVRTDKGGAAYARLGVEQADRLRKIARDAGTTLHDLMLAAFHVLLHRYSGQDDIIVGLPKAARTRDTARTLGYFVNTIPLRANLSGNPTFTAFLAQVSDTVKQCFAHDAFPFSLMVERLQPERTINVSPIFQVAFAWQKTTRLVDPEKIASFALGEEGAGVQMGPMLVESAVMPFRTSPFDMTLWIAEAGDDLGATLEYSHDLFEHETASRMLGHYEQLLKGIAENADRPISDLPLLTERERRQILVEWNETESVCEPFKFAHVLFEEQAARTPDAVAVVLGDEQVTYAELNRRANQLAHALKTRGVEPGVLVGVGMERSIDMVVGLLGVLKAGGVYLPLDPAYPAERIAFMLEDAGAPILLTQAALADLAPAFKGQVLRLDTDRATIEREPTSNPVVNLSPDDPAYVIYTSGSTGQPKGVVISQESLTNHCRDMQRAYDLTAEDRVLQFASINFDPSLEQILPTLFAGARLVLRGQDLWTPQAFGEFVAESGLTVINLPPSYWHQVVTAWANAGESLPANRLRLVIIGGDVLQPETIRLWWQTPMKRVRLLNAYGPTETTITSTTFDVTAYGEKALSLRRVPIGRPTPGRRLYVLDRYGKPVPVGVPGELYIGGPRVALSYLYRPKLTAEKFLPDLFSGEPGARMYRTGDLVRYLPDGNLEFLGRMDHQVKVRGFRVELGEIEAVLSAHPRVREAVVAVREDAPGDRQLVAYIVPVRGAQLMGDDLREYLLAKLPAYMVPAAFVTLDELPLGPSGKVDRRALPVPNGNHHWAQQKFVAPRTPLERELAQMWADVLGVEKVGIHTSFFDLGGHSLLATQLIARVEECFHIDLPVRRLFERPTVAGLAEVITQRMAEDEADDELEALLRELEALPEEEVKHLLFN